MSDIPPPPLSDDARRILDMVREEPVDDASIKRVKVRVAAAVGLAALVPAATAQSTVATTTSTTLSAKLAIFGVAGVLALGALAYLATRSHNAPQPTSIAPSSSSAEPIPSAITPPPPVEIVQPAQPTTSVAPSAAPPPVVATHPTAKVSAPAPSASAEIVDTLAAERALLATAQHELSAKNYAKARATYEQHLADYPHGVLRTEAAVGRVLAMCGMNDPSGAAEAEKVLATKPPSALAKRLRTACGVE